MAPVAFGSDRYWLRWSLAPITFDSACRMLVLGPYRLQLLATLLCVALVIPVLFGWRLALARALSSDHC
jgi:hypothetical protein